MGFLVVNGFLSNKKIFDMTVSSKKQLFDGTTFLSVKQLFDRTHGGRVPSNKKLFDGIGPLMNNYLTKPLVVGSRQISIYKATLSVRACVHLSTLNSRPDRARIGGPVGP